MFIRRLLINAHSQTHDQIHWLIKENIPVKGEYGGENSMYRNHAFSTMRKFFKEKNFPKEWMTAWF